MTCIVGVIEKETVHMGCDSIGTDGWRKEVRSRPKLFRNGPMLIGYCGSFRMGQLLEVALSPPKLMPDEDLFRYMVKEFVPAVRQVVKDGGCGKKQDEAERLDGAFLVAARGRLFTVQADFQVAETVDGYAACGSGETFALGSLHTSRSMIVTAADRIKAALAAAADHCATVAPPFHFESLTP